MRVLVASTYVPFVKDGGTKVVEDLARELTARGFETDVTFLPFHAAWPDGPQQTAAVRLLDLTESCGNTVDRLITVRGPAYALKHPSKVAWLVDHHREAYDLWGTDRCGLPDDDVGRHHRDVTRRSDDLYLRECHKVFTASRAAADRVRKFNRVEPDGVLYTPLETGHRFGPGPFGDYIVSVSRLSPLAREGLAVDAMRYTDPDVRLVLVGPSDDAHGAAIRDRVRAAGVADRVRVTGGVSDEEAAALTAGCCAALCLPHDEDGCGYPTVAALHAHKPVVTLTDAGGPLEVVADGESGLVCAPEPRALAEAMNRLWRDRPAAGRMGATAHRALARHRIDWDHVIENLTA